MKKNRKLSSFVSFAFVWLLIDITSPTAMTGVRINTDLISHYTAITEGETIVGTSIRQADGAVITTDTLPSTFDAYFCNGGTVPCPQ